MKLTVYQSNKGDCLLLSSSNQQHMLIDGGMSKSFNAHTAQHLSDIGHLDRVCVTHIDQDHIQGILELCNHIVGWKVFEFQQSQGNTRFKRPKYPKPPTIDAFWHNSFDAQFGDQSSTITNMALSLSTIFSAGGSWSNNISNVLSGIATSQREGYLLTQQLGSKLLNMPINPEVDGDMLVSKSNEPTTFTLGDTTIRLIGPMQAEIDKLRDEWEDWIATADGAAAIEKVNKSVREDADSLTSSAAGALSEALLSAEEEVNLSFKSKSGDIGERSKVTTPNLASIMFIAEEGDKKILFTGDGHSDDIDIGIDADGKFDSRAGIHFDVIKVPHHGSEFNSHLPFWRRMTADHYVFCSNGAHENPDIRILERIIQSREEDVDKNKPHSGAPYKLWFNSSSSVTSGDRSKHMKEVEKFVKRKRTRNRMSFEFLDADSFSVSL